MCDMFGFRESRRPSQGRGGPFESLHLAHAAHAAYVLANPLPTCGINGRAKVEAMRWISTLKINIFRCTVA